MSTVLPAAPPRSGVPVPRRSGPGRRSPRPPVTGTAPAGTPEVVVSARGELDIATADELRHRLLAALAGNPVVVADLSEVTFCDCSGLRVIEDARRAAARGGRTLLLRGAGDRVRRLFELTGLANALDPAP
jgi:anti-anti-sigma factor